MNDALQPGEGGAKLGIGAGGRRVNLVRLAEAQRLLIWCILVRLLAEGGFYFFMRGSFPPLLAYAYLGFYLCVNIAAIVLVVRMARAYGSNWFMAILGAIVTLLSCIGLIVLVLLNQRVIATLQRAGAKVGFFGVGAAEMNTLREGVCKGCGYDIRGLPSPQCPECGRAIGA